MHTLMRLPAKVIGKSIQLPPQAPPRRDASGKGLERNLAIGLKQLGQPDE